MSQTDDLLSERLRVAAEQRRARMEAAKQPWVKAYDQRRCAHPGCDNFPRFGYAPPANGDSTATTEIPRLGATGAAAGWPTAQPTQPRLPRPHTPVVAGPQAPPAAATSHGVVDHRIPAPQADAAGSDQQSEEPP